MTEAEFIEFVGNFDAKNVLDVATGHGGFLHALQQWFPNADRFIGIDALEKAIQHAHKASSELPKTEFMLMDAHRMTFNNGEFDVVAICNSLHHLSDPEVALKEMKRVLRPGGLFIVYEMINDGQTESQMTHVLFHHWWAKVDSQLGISHHPTYSRAELQSLISKLSLSNLESFDDVSLDGDPKAVEATERFRTGFQDYLVRAKDLPDFEIIKEEGEKLLQRLDIHGVHGATEVLIFGTK